MMISTRGRYALRVMIELSSRRGDGFTPLKEITAAQGISQKYLESIMTVLSKAGYVEAQHGKGGGYRLSREPADYTVGSVLKLTEGSLAPVACLESGNPVCCRAESCKTLPVWIELDRIVNEYLEGVRLSDLL